MTNPFKSPFTATFSAEVLFNSKRVAPYFLILLFTAHSFLWWGWSAAATFGWSTNSDFNIVRNLQGFSFILGLPIFNAVIMGDPVIRDFRVGIDPLIFSKPAGRASYLLGKFFGNFFVLICCMSAFALTMMLLQWVPMSRLVVQPARVFPYFKHFFFFVVISHLILAAVYFTLGTLTRSARIVYGLAVAFYPIYISYQLLLLRNLPQSWRVILDPMMLRSNEIPRDKWQDTTWINQIVISYSSDMVANRALMIVAAALCLMILYFRFSIVERTSNQDQFSWLDLSKPSDRIQFDLETLEGPDRRGPPDRADDQATAMPQSGSLPKVTRVNEGIRANLRKLVAATGLELRLLRSEKGLMVLMPLALILSFLSLPFSAGVSGVSPSAAFAKATTDGALLFLLGVIVFYAGEAMHRDREMRIEPGLWSAPVPNHVFLISKFVAILSLTLGLLLLIGLTAMLTQLLRGLIPIEVSAYLVAYSVIMVPSLAFMAAACIALNVLLRDKYLAYAIIIAMGSGLFYLYTLGYNHWLYNPVLYRLWRESDLVSMEGAARILVLRIYCLVITLLCILLAHVCFERKSGKTLQRATSRQV